MFEAVAVDVAEFERETVLRDVYDKLAVAEGQVERGMLLDGREIFDRLRQKYVAIHTHFLALHALPPSSFGRHLPL